MTSHPAFRFIRKETISTLNVTIEEYTHINTGAVHYHLAADNPENVFLAGFRTVPMDHKGVAHILEHTALCGSKRFNVRDPFFMMIRRSLNTFMNAFTSNDWTAYPFASQNKKDFNNLLDVYLDAVFFANLSELDFLQEGHRVEFEKADDPSSDLVYKGVVFNEMKGAMSSVNSTLWQTLCKYLFPSTTYHFNSGGDPEYITDLSYDELKSFYKAHYHPSNAILMTYGDIPAVEHQTQFEEKALKHFDRSSDYIYVANEKRLQAPIKVQEAYAFDSPDDAETATQLNIGWLLGQNTHLKDLLHAQLLSYVLLENSASPLQKYLESTELGSAPSALCGMEDSYKELVFVCGISGAKACDTDRFTHEVLAVLQKVADEGVPIERLEAIVHQLELSQREISGDSYPYGLQIILTALPCVTHRGDPVELLNLEPVLDELRESIKDPEFIKGLVQTLLIDNQHRVILTAVADKGLSTRKIQAEKEQLNKIKQNLDEQQVQSIIEQTKALNARQSEIDDPENLPKVTLADIPDDITVIEGKDYEENPQGEEKRLATYYQQGTNGLTYQQILLPLPSLNEEQLSLLPFYCQCLTELGFTDTSYLDVQNRQSEVVGSIHAFSSVKAHLDDAQKVKGYMGISAKALNRQQADMSELIQDTLNKITFTEKQRIKELVSQIKQRREQSITGNGHMLAAATAASTMSGLASMTNRLSGIPAIKAIKALDAALTDDNALAQYCQSLQALHDIIRAQPCQLLLISDAPAPDSIEAVHQGFWQHTSKDQGSLSLPPMREKIKQAWIANTQVNFCAKAYPTVPLEHPDAPALTILGGFLRNGYLHTAIREKGGAYGAGASQDNNFACFKFYSYRDPRLSGTLDDFDSAIEWLKNNEHTADQLEEAILGVISSLDKPASPAGEAKHAYYYQLFGQTPEKRRAFRKAILAVTLDDLKNLADTYFTADKASVGVISSDAFEEELKALNLDILIV